MIDYHKLKILYLVFVRVEFLNKLFFFHLQRLKFAFCQ